MLKPLSSSFAHRCQQQRRLAGGDAAARHGRGGQVQGGGSPGAQNRQEYPHNIGRVNKRSTSHYTTVTKLRHEASLRKLGDVPNRRRDGDRGFETSSAEVREEVASRDAPTGGAPTEPGTVKASVFQRLGRQPSPRRRRESPDRFPNLRVCPSRGVLSGGLQSVSLDGRNPPLPRSRWHLLQL